MITVRSASRDYSSLLGTPASVDTDDLVVYLRGGRHFSV